jgi:hypothetical protein
MATLLEEAQAADAEQKKVQTTSATQETPQQEVQNIQGTLASTAGQVGGPKVIAATPQIAVPPTLGPMPTVGATPAPKAQAVVQPTLTNEQATAAMNELQKVRNAAPVQNVTYDPQTDSYTWIGPVKGQKESMKRADFESQVGTHLKPAEATATATPTPTPKPEEAHLPDHLQNAKPDETVGDNSAKSDAFKGTYLGMGTAPNGTRYPHFRDASGQDYWLHSSDPEADYRIYPGSSMTEPRRVANPAYVQTEEINKNPAVISLLASNPNATQEEKLAAFADERARQILTALPDGGKALNANVQGQDLISQIRGITSKMKPTDYGAVAQYVNNAKEFLAGNPGTAQILAYAKQNNIPDNYIDLFSKLAQLQSLVTTESFGHPERTMEARLTLGSLGDAKTPVSLNQRLKSFDDFLKYQLQGDVANAESVHQAVPRNAMIRAYILQHPGENIDVSKIPAQPGTSKTIIQPPVAAGANQATATATPAPSLGKDSQGYQMIRNNADKAALPPGTPFVFVDQNGNPTQKRGVK